MECMGFRVVPLVSVRELEGFDGHGIMPSVLTWRQWVWVLARVSIG